MLDRGWSEYFVSLSSSNAPVALVFYINIQTHTKDEDCLTPFTSAELFSVLVLCSANVLM